MLQVNPDSLVEAFRATVDMEVRGQQLDDVLRRLKDVFVQSRGDASLPNTIGVLDELHWHLQQFQKQSAKVDRSLGIRRSAISPPANQARIDTPQLRGCATSIPLTDLVTILGKRKKTGTLRIKTNHGEKFVLEFLSGSVVHVVSDTPLPGRMLGNILVAQQKLSGERLRRFLADFSPGSGPIGQALARAQLVNASDLLDAIEAQAQELFERIFALEDAMFCFTEGPVSQIEHRVTLNVAYLLSESAIRRERTDTEAEPIGADSNHATLADRTEANAAVSELLDAIVREQAVLLVGEGDEDADHGDADPVDGVGDDSAR